MNLRKLSNRERITAIKDRPVPDGIFDYLRYCSESGKIYWIKNRGTTAKAGVEAGYLNGDGYRRVIFGGSMMMAHRVAWLLMHREWPGGEIDHIDGDRTNNRIENLRVVTQSENMRNKKTKSLSSSGRNGVHFDTRCKKWRVQIRMNKKVHHLGLFESKEIASSVAESFYRSNGFTELHATGRVG